MSRWLTLWVVGALGSGCAGGLKAVDRGQWVLVTAGDGKGEEVVTRDTYDAEVVEGRERKSKRAADEKPPVLHEAPKELTAAPGEVLRFRINEGLDVEVQSDEAVVESYWTESYPVDGWRGDQAVEGRESMLFLRARKAGKGKLKLIDRTWGTHEFEITVK